MVTTAEVSLCLPLQIRTGLDRARAWGNLISRLEDKCLVLREKVEQYTILDKSNLHSDLLRHLVVIWD